MGVPHHSKKARCRLVALESVDCSDLLVRNAGRLVQVSGRSEKNYELLFSPSHQIFIADRHHLGPSQDPPKSSVPSGLD